jgi:hypothetical protein
MWRMATRLNNTGLVVWVNFTNIFERNCAIFFAPIKSLTFTSSAKISFA